MKIKIISFLILFFCFANLSAQIDTLKLNEDSENRIYIHNQFIKFYTDNSNNLSFDQIRTTEYNSLFIKPDSLSIYKKNTNIWYKFYVKNQTDKLTEYIIAIPDYTFIDFYVIDKAGNVELLKAGTELKISQKQLRNDRLEKVIITLDNNEVKTIYIKAYARVALKIQDAIFVQKALNYYENLNIANLIQGFLIGFLVVIFIYNIILFLMTKQKSYLFYSLYAFFINISILALHRFFLIYITPENPLLNSYFGLSIFFAFIFYYLFIREFLDSKFNNHKLDNYLKKLIKTNTIISFALIILSFFNYFIYALLTLLFFLNNMIIIIIIAVKTLRKSDLLSKIFALGSFFLVTGTLIGVISSLWGQNQFFVIYLFQISIAIEGLIFTIGLGYKYKLSEDKIKFSQSKLIEQYKEYELLQTKVTRELEEKVSERTTQIKKQNNEIKSLYQEMHHRVKNNISFIIGILEIQKECENNEEVKNTLAYISTRIHSVGLIHELIYNNLLETSISAKKYFEQLADYILDIVNDTHKNKIEIDCPVDLFLSVHSAVSLGIIINELFLNSLKHAKTKDGNKDCFLSINKDKDNIFIKYKDNGCVEISEEEITKSNSIGLFLIRTMTQQLEGEMKLDLSCGFAAVFLFDLKKI